MFVLYPFSSASSTSCFFAARLIHLVHPLLVHLVRRPEATGDLLHHGGVHARVVALLQHVVRGAQGIQLERVVVGPLGDEQEAGHGGMGAVPGRDGLHVHRG
jgi:hypothetical protein